MKSYDVSVVGGGLGGLVTASLLARQGFSVKLTERGSWPQHKVCGEYISNEVIPLLNALGYNPFHRGAVSIDTLQLTLPSGKSLQRKLDLGGFGISRFRIDSDLAEIALKLGVILTEKSTVTGIQKNGEKFQIATTSEPLEEAAVVVHAAGKWSNLDRLLERSFFQEKNLHIGIKSHFEIDHPAHWVSLHNFRGGYAGVSCVEENRVNVCYLTTQEILQQYGSIEEMEQHHLSENPHLARIFSQGKRLFEKPKVISNVSFLAKRPVEQNILMVGDSAGLIAPLSGNGMSLAMRSGYLAALHIGRFLRHEITRAEMEKHYAQDWQNQLGYRIRRGHKIQALFGKNRVSSLAFGFLSTFPSILKPIIKSTHGNPFNPEI